MIAFAAFATATDATCQAFPYIDKDGSPSFENFDDRYTSLSYHLVHHANLENTCTRLNSLVALLSPLSSSRLSPSGRPAVCLNRVGVVSARPGGSARLLVDVDNVDDGTVGLEKSVKVDHNDPKSHSLPRP
jgi:hypothetical protein